MCDKIKLSCFQLNVGGEVLVEIYGCDRSSSGGCGRTDVISQGMIRRCWLGLTQNMLKTDVSGLQSTTAFLMELGSGIHDCALGKFIYTTITLVAGACMLFVPVLRPRYINLPWVAMCVLKWFSKDCVFMPSHAHCWYLCYMLHRICTVIISTCHFLLQCSNGNSLVAPIVVPVSPNLFAQIIHVEDRLPFHHLELP
jgi:hypothetical protein